MNVKTKIKFITSGAVAGRPSWRGAGHNEEGFLHIKIRNNRIEWNYIDYGWEVQDPGN